MNPKTNEEALRVKISKKLVLVNSASSLVTRMLSISVAHDRGDDEYGDFFFLRDLVRLLSPSLMDEKTVAGFMTNVSDAAEPGRLDDMHALMQAEAAGGPTRTATTAGHDAHTGAHD